MKFLPYFMIALFFCAISSASAADRIEPPKDCKQCGMDRVAFAHGRMQIIYADGTAAGTCSLNCAALEMKANRGKKVRKLLVADYTSKKLMDAEKAIWVVGGNRPGIMTEMPKWAFSRKLDAQKFVRDYGGRVTDFTEALNLALRENE